MKKPLELIWYWPVNCGEPCNCNEYWAGDRPIPDFAVDVQVKRLTEHELAAEVWHSIVKFYSKEPSTDAVEEACRNAVIERFATKPHYDEADQ
jgi:hypothetical protein